MMSSLPRGLVGLFRFQLGRKCLRDDFAVAYHEGIGGKRSIIKGRVSRPEDVRNFAFDDLLRQIKRSLAGWKHARKNLCEQRTYLPQPFECPLWSDEHRIASIVSHNRLDIAGCESLPVMQQYSSRLFGMAYSHLRCLPNGFRFVRASVY